MAIVLSEHLGRLVRDRIASGEYASEEEVLLAAMRSLQAEDATVVAIEAGLADIEAGRVQPLDEVDSELRATRPYLADD